jgi:hypothetical protein
MRISGSKHSALTTKRNMVSWIGMVVLAFNLAGGRALPYDFTRADAPKVSDSGFGEICTQSGFAALGGSAASDPSQAPAQQPSPHSHHAACAFCLPLLHGGLDRVADGPSPGAPELAGVAQASFPSSRPLMGSCSKGAANGPRAPPFA